MNGGIAIQEIDGSDFRGHRGMRLRERSPKSQKVNRRGSDSVTDA